MLLTKLWWTTDTGHNHVAYVRTDNVGRARRSQYRIDVVNSSRTMISDGLLDNYPQWSESALGLVARAIHQMKVTVANILYWHPPEKLKAPESRVSNLDLSVAVSPEGPGSGREIEGLHVSVSGGLATCQYRNDAYIGDAFPFRLIAGDEDPCHLAVHAICQTLWGTSTLVSVPEPLRVPVHAWGSVRYVRLTDIPELARRDFTRHLSYVERPIIPAERKENCAFASDWECFLIGEVRFETGFVPGLRWQVPY